MDNLALWQQILLGPAGTAASLLAILFYYLKFIKPSDDKRQDDREKLLLSQYEQQRMDHRTDIASLITSCKDQICEVVRGHESEVSMMKEALQQISRTVDSNTTAVRDATEQSRKMCAMYLALAKGHPSFELIKGAANE